jgi:hypothetical protein
MLVVLGACGRIAFDPLGGSSSSDAHTGWWNPDFRRRIKLVIDPPTQTVVDLPLMVQLDPARIDYSHTQDAAQDLRFIDQDGSTSLPFEIERWDEAGTSIVWVRVPEIPIGAKHIWLYYDNPTAPGVADPAAVWSAFALVWHLGDNPAGPAPQIADSTGHGNDGTAGGGMPAGAQGPGRIAGSLAFDGNNDAITIAGPRPDLQLLGNLTFSAWIDRAANQEQWVVDFCIPDSENAAANHLYELSIDTNGEVTLEWEYGGGTDEATTSSVGMPTTNGTWMHLGVVRDVGVVRYFLDGAPLGTPQPFTNNPTGGTAGTFYLGGEPSSTSSKSYLAGRQDEVRLQGVAQTASWMLYDYRSMTDGLITYGVPEPY